MNAHLRTLPLPSAVQPVRELGASALDRSATAWPAPAASARVLDRWGMPPRDEASITWPAPDPVMRFDLPAPDLGDTAWLSDHTIRWAELIEPRHEVLAPDLHMAARAAIAPPVEVVANSWPAPTLGTAASTDVAELAVGAELEPARLTAGAVVGLAAVVGAIVLGTVAVLGLF